MTAVWPAVCATGHRPQHLPADTHGWVRKQLARVAVKLRDGHATTVGISGMALGTDMWWAQAILDAGLDLHAYIPCLDQTARWPAHAKTEWRRILDRAAVVHQTADRYSHACMQRRNEQMVDAAQLVVAVYGRSKSGGGTRNAIGYAEKVGRPFVHIDPQAQRVVGPVRAILPPKGTLLQLRTSLT